MSLKQTAAFMLALAVSFGAAAPSIAQDDQSQGFRTTPAPESGDAPVENTNGNSYEGNQNRLANDANDYGNNQRSGDVPQESYTQEETVNAASKFFGGTTSGLAKAIEKVFSENGKPVAYIIGNEGAGAFIVGFRYGSGKLVYKNGGSTDVYWQGPSVGFDFGGNASKVFTLVYNLHWTRDIYQRFPGVDGSLYVVAGVGLNYQRANDITLAPIRTGVGLRAGANIGYLSYSREQHILPF